MVVTGLPAVSQHFQTLAGDAHLMFDRLINIGNGRHNNRFGLPSRRRQFLPQQFGSIGLGHDLGFKIKSAAETEKFVIRAGKAINTPVLAAAVGIQGPIEGDIRCWNDMIDNRLGAVEKNLPLDPASGAALDFLFDPLPIDFFTEDMQASGFEAIARIESCAAAMNGPIRECVAVGEVVGRSYLPLC